MRQRMQQALVVAAAAAAVFSLHVPGRILAAGPQEQKTTLLDIAGAAGAALELALNGGKIADGTPDADGNESFQVALGTETRTRVTVWVDRCEDNKVVRVQLVVEGNAEPPKDEGCDRKLAGFFWSTVPRVQLNIITGILNTPPRFGLRTLGLITGAVVAGGVGIATLGGSDSTTTPAGQTPSGSTPGASAPEGSYQSTSFVKADPGTHAAFTALANALLLIATANSPLTIAGPAGSNWVTVSGDFDTGTRRFVLTGRGTVAGFANVGVRFEGTISSTGALSGDYTMGTGGELPGGQAIVYGVTGQKQ